MSLTEAIFARPSYSQMERLIAAEEVKNRIMSTYVGTPLVASTAAGMTDTDRIYVYVGSETGYTSGNWYYYDGSAWTSGGVYNSTAFETDDTLTIPDAAADSKAVGDELSDLKNALTTKAEQDGAYPDLTAGQMLSKNESADSVPYNFRAVGHEATLEYTDAIVGGSVVQNQLVNGSWYITGGTKTENADGTCTFTANASGQQVYKMTDVLAHKFFVMSVFKTNSATADVGMRVYSKNYYGNATIDWQTISTIVAINSPTGISIGIVDSRDSGWDAITVKYFILTDLTAMLGTAIADYIYTLETVTSGAGVAWLKKHFPKLFTYQDYNAGEIVSVQGLSQHITRDADNNIIGTYPLDDSLTLRGILKLDSNNQLYADGDRYLPDGTVQRRYGSVTLNGTQSVLASNFLSGGYVQYDTRNFADGEGKGSGNGINTYYRWTHGDSTGTLVTMYSEGGYTRLLFRDERFGDTITTATQWNTWLASNPLTVVYELKTPTTEEADPYTVPQIVDPDGTEEFVSTSIVPVGHESRYPIDIAGRLDKILTMPTANGTYTLRATVNNGAVTYAWVST